MRRYIFSVLITALFLWGCGSASPAARGSAAAPKPAWVDVPQTGYDARQYVTAVGAGNGRATAERNALAALTAVFGQSIQADQRISSVYQAAVQSGAAAEWSDRTAVEDIITTSTALESLVGAEITDSWDSGRGEHYARAVLEKAKAARIYSGLVRSNQELIDTLTEMNAAEKNSLEGFRRYRFAAAVADINAGFVNLLSVIGAAPPAGLSRGGDLRLEAEAIAQSIPVRVRVAGDRGGRIAAAFSRAIAAQGFSGGGNEARYALEAELSIAGAQFAAQQNEFVRYTLTASLKDARGGTEMLPYSVSGREGHLTLAEAENRAAAAVERKIGEEFGPLLAEYLSRLLPRK